MTSPEILQGSPRDSPVPWGLGWGGHVSQTLPRLRGTCGHCAVGDLPRSPQGSPCVRHRRHVPASDPICVQCEVAARDRETWRARLPHPGCVGPPPHTLCQLDDERRPGLSGRRSPTPLQTSGSKAQPALRSKPACRLRSQAASVHGGDPSSHGLGHHSGEAHLHPVPLSAGWLPTLPPAVPQKPPCIAPRRAAAPQVSSGAWECGQHPALSHPFLGQPAHPALLALEGLLHPPLTRPSSPRKAPLGPSSTGVCCQLHGG